MQTWTITAVNSVNSMQYAGEGDAVQMLATLVVLAAHYKRMDWEASHMPLDAEWSYQWDNRRLVGRRKTDWH